jgi:hypothetical protein
VAGEQTKLARAIALAAAPTLAHDPLSTTIASDNARPAAEGYAAEMPLPEGGNFHGIQWEQAGGVMAVRELQTVLAYNAACQWLRASRDGRESSIAAQVFAQVPRWPALRDTHAGRALAEAAAAETSEIASALLASCRASHLREVQYARSRGLAASS